MCATVCVKNKTCVSDGGVAFKRRPSSRKVNLNHRKSAAFLDVPPPPGDGKKPAPEPEDPENSYRLRSFSFTSKGETLRVSCR